MLCPAHTATRHRTIESPTLLPAWSHFAIVHQVQRLRAERRESGVPAANSDHHELARRRADEHAPVYP
jgi:hypothetical protein